MPFMYCKMWYDVTDDVIGLKTPKSPMTTVRQKNAPDIEVVGERCRRKNEPRPLNVVELTDDLALCSDNFLPKPYGTLQQPPNSGKRPATTGHAAYLNSSSWRHTPFYRRENSSAGRSIGGLADDRKSVSRGETGVKVRISYVDRKGRVSATPKAQTLSANIAPAPPDNDGGSAQQGQHHHQQQHHNPQQHHPDDSWDAANGLSGWESGGMHVKAITANVTDRLYRHSSRMSRDKAFSVVLDQHNGYPDVIVPLGSSSEYGSMDQIGGENNAEKLMPPVTPSMPSLGRAGVVGLGRSRSAPRSRDGVVTQTSDSFPANSDESCADLYASSPSLLKTTSGNDTAAGHPRISSKENMQPKLSSTPNFSGNVVASTSTRGGGCLIHSSSGTFYSSDPRLASFYDDRLHYIAGSMSASVNSIETSAAPNNSDVTSLQSSLSVIHNNDAGACSNCPEHIPSQQKPPLPPHHHHQHLPNPSHRTPPHQHEQPQQQQQPQHQPSQNLSPIQQEEQFPSRKSSPQQQQQQQQFQRRPLYQQRRLSDRLPTSQFPRPFTTASSRMDPRNKPSTRVSDCVKEQLLNLYLSSSQRRARSAAVLSRSRGKDGGDSASRRQSMKRASVIQESTAPVSRMFRKFRMVGMITISLIRLKAAIVVNSSDRTERSAAEIQWRTLFGEEQENRLAFNKSHYSREKISTKIPTWAMDILEIPPEDRTEQDCRRLHALFRGMRSFDKFTEEIQLNLCRAFTFTFVEGSRIIIRRGHVGHNFYLIYSGSVFVNVKDVDNNGELFIKTEAILSRGDSFGELALLQDIGRTATISVREPCELLVVDKDVFGRVCPKIFEKELMEKKKFILGLTLFNPKVWTQEALKTLCIEAQIQEYKINRIIVENNRTEDWLYICMEGKCQVIRCLSEDGDNADDEAAKPSRDGTLALLSQEIIELLSSVSRTTGQEEEEDEEDSKEKLLASLGLEYAESGKRNAAFIQEMAEEERKKALRATTGPSTLTALMAQQRKESKSPLVYLNVGCLEAEGIFDLSSLVKCPGQPRSSSLILVSSGARMLRVKKTAFTRLASHEAMQHTATLISKQTVPTDAAILESYKTKVAWDAYKARVLKEVFTSKGTRIAAAHHAQLRGEPGDKDMLIESALSSSPLDTGKTPASGRPQSHKPEKRKKQASRGGAVRREQTADQKVKDDDTIEEVVEETKGSDEEVQVEGGDEYEDEAGGGADEDKETNTRRLGAAVHLPGEEEAAPAIFPVVQVDTTAYPPTPRFVPPPDVDGNAGQETLAPQIRPSLVGPAPTNVIIHRSTGAPGVYRPYSSQDTQFTPASKPGATKGYKKLGDVDTDSDDEPDEDY